MADVQSKLDYVQSVADWFLDLGDDEFRRGNIEAGLKYNHVASIALESQNRDLASPRIESNLRLVASRLASQGVLQQYPPVRTGLQQRCLHILNEALPAGGLTAMASRWMSIDSGRAHSVALLSQEVPVPASLRQVVERSGGKIYTADTKSSFASRAGYLRRLAAEEADYVILHIGLSDVLCGVAFGVPGGPPVMLVNHAAHLYWNGASTIDQVVNCRGSELELFWSATYRGVGSSRCTIVPIPLEDDPNRREREDASTVELKRSARQTLGIASDATVILTVGSRFKYLPIDGLDFIETWKQILEAVPKAELLVVGFDGDQRWRSASAFVENRIRTLGAMPRSELLKLMNAVDLYVEAFPFGTTTSLLEAGLQGIPVALAPAQSPPPYGTDGIALDAILRRPSTVSDYQAGIMDLCHSVDKRTALGSKVRTSILRHHCGTGWKEHLEAAIGSLPRQHTVLAEIAPVRTPPAVHAIWSMFVPQWTSGYENILEITATRALALGLQPSFTAAIRQACRDHQTLRRWRSVPAPILALLFNVVLPLLPKAWSERVFRLSVFLCRGSLISRTWMKIASLIGHNKRPTAPYQEYRHMRETP